MNKFASYVFSLLMLLLSQPMLVSADTTSTHVIRLTFGKEIQPPECFFPHREVVRPRVGLALSGGGARGFAQIGVLQVLEENNIPVDIIVGTSIGSIVGGLYAAGYSSHELEKVTEQINWSKIIVDKPPRSSLFVGQKQERSRAVLNLRFRNFKIALPQAVTPGQKLTSILTKLTLGADFRSGSNFDNLKIPFRALACDLISGKKILLQDGSLADAMRSSSAVPLLFEPVARDQMLLVDGGLINNIPVDEAADFDVDLIIAVDTSSELNDYSQLKTPWKIADQVTTIMQKEKKHLQSAKADIVIQPELEDIKSDGFQSIDQLIAAGKLATQNKINKIKSLIQQKQTPPLSGEKHPIGSINFRCDEKSLTVKATDVVKQSLDGSASLEDVHQTLFKLYELGYFQDAFAECQFCDSLLNLTFVLKANPRFSSVQFKNNTVFSDSLLNAQISSVPGVPIHHPTSKKDVARILQLYQQAGYSIMGVDKIDFRSDTLTIFINEGIVSDIQVDGNIRTLEFVITREFPLKKGDIFNMNLVDQGVNDIYSSNLFKTVSIDLAQQKDKSAKLTIRVEEKAFNVLRMSLHHDLERKNKALIEVIDENFIGMANPLSLQAQYGLKDRLFKFKYRSDRILNTYLTMTLEIYHHQLRNFVYENGAKFGEYQLRDNGISLSFGRQIERLGVLSLIASIDDIYLKPISGSGYPTGRYDLKTLSLQSIVDTQDQFPFPTSGKYYLFLYKLSSASIFNSQTSFFKLYSSLELYQTFFNRNTIHPKLLWGTSDLSTPFFEFFELGGQNSFFGLNDKELLGRHLVCGSLEYRYRFPFGFAFDFYFSIRYDVGATWKNYVEITPRDFFQGIGTSLAMNTPAGPISVSIGRMNRGKTVLYFSAGFDF